MKQIKNNWYSLLEVKNEQEAYLLAQTIIKKTNDEHCASAFGERFEQGLLTALILYAVEHCALEYCYLSGIYYILTGGTDNLDITFKSLPDDDRTGNSILKSEILARKPAIALSPASASG